MMSDSDRVNPHAHALSSRQLHILLSTYIHMLMNISCAFICMHARTLTHAHTHTYLHMYACIPTNLQIGNRKKGEKSISTIKDVIGLVCEFSFIG